MQYNEINICIFNPEQIIKDRTVFGLQYHFTSVGLNSRLGYVMMTLRYFFLILELFVEGFNGNVSLYVYGEWVINQTFRFINLVILVLDRTLYLISPDVQLQLYKVEYFHIQLRALDIRKSMWNVRFVAISLLTL